MTANFQDYLDGIAEPYQVTDKDMRDHYREQCRTIQLAIKALVHKRKLLGSAVPDPFNPAFNAEALKRKIAAIDRCISDQQRSLVNAEMWLDSFLEQ